MARGSRSAPHPPLSKDHDPRVVPLKGLGTLGRQWKMKRLYTRPVDPHGLFEAACWRLRDAFARFLVTESRGMVLQTTLVNIRFLEASDRMKILAERKRGKRRQF